MHRGISLQNSFILFAFEVVPRTVVNSNSTAEILLIACQLSNCYSRRNFSIWQPIFWLLIYNAAVRERVSSDFQTPRRELKIRRVAEYFWRNSRCLEIGWNITYPWVFDISSQSRKKQLRSKRRYKIVNKSMLHILRIKYANYRHGYDLLFLGYLSTWHWYSYDGRLFCSWKQSEYVSEC